MPNDREGVVYYVDMDHVLTVTDEGDGTGREWAWTGGSECFESSVKGIWRSKPDLPYGWIEISPEKHRAVYAVDDIPVGGTAWVMVVRYRDGDTFGYNGYADVVGVFSTLEAAVVAERRCWDTTDEGDYHVAYRPWDGYFSSLTGVDIHEVKVQA